MFLKSHRRKLITKTRSVCKTLRVCLTIARRAATGLFSVFYNVRVCPPPISINVSAIARPMPRLAPVMRATLFERCMSMKLRLFPDVLSVLMKMLEMQKITVTQR